MQDPQQVKLALYTKCLEFADQRISNIQQAIDAGKISENDETKSSAGDKHETGRAMMQLEQEKNADQLIEAYKLKMVISKIDPGQHTNVISSGSLVVTNKGSFYISISAGKIDLAGDIYYAISAQSPIAIKLIGLPIGKEFSFNDQFYKIEQIY